MCIIIKANFYLIYNCKSGTYLLWYSWWIVIILVPVTYCITQVKFVMHCIWLITCGLMLHVSYFLYVVHCFMLEGYFQHDITLVSLITKQYVYYDQMFCCSGCHMALGNQGLPKLISLFDQLTSWTSININPYTGLISWASISGD